MDVLTHVLIPALILLAVGVKASRVAVVAPLMVLPDLDWLVPPHRAVLHNVFVLALVATAAWFAARRLDRGHAREWTGLAAFAFGAHLLLDLPTAVALLWPVTSAAPYVSAQLFVDTAAGALAFVPALEAGVLPHPPGEGPVSLELAGGPPLVLAVANWSVATLVLLAVAWVQFHPSTARVRHAVVTRVPFTRPAHAEEVDA